MMRMELASGWGFLYDEISDIFESLVKRTSDQFEELKLLLKRKLVRKQGDDAYAKHFSLQDRGSHPQWLIASIIESTMSSTNS